MWQLMWQLSRHRARDHGGCQSTLLTACSKVDKRLFRAWHRVRLQCVWQSTAGQNTMLQDLAGWNRHIMTGQCTAGAAWQDRAQQAQHGRTGHSRRRTAGCGRAGQSKTEHGRAIQSEQGCIRTATGQGEQRPGSDIKASCLAKRKHVMPVE